MGEMRRIEAMVDSGAADDITSAVRDGEYANADAVLGEALALWRSFRDREQSCLKNLRTTIAEVIERDEWLEGNFTLAEIRADDRTDAPLFDS